MRWRAFLGLASVGLGLLAGCGRRQAEPQSQSTERRDTRIDPGEAKRLRSAAEEFLRALRVQDFDTMWALTAPESKSKLGIGNFVKQYTTRGSAKILDARVTTVEGLEEDRALVHSELLVQYQAPFFQETRPGPTQMKWEDEWVQGPDGQWYRVVPETQRPPEELETICGATTTPPR